MKHKYKIAIFRFSSLGDVAMTVPVLEQLLSQHPHIELIVISRVEYKALFASLSRTTFLGFDLEHEYKSTASLYKIAQKIKKYKPTHLADLHNVLRTQLIRKFFVFSKVKIAVLNKGRKEKKELTTAINKKLFPLKTMFQRYADVFEQLGFSVELQPSIQSKKQENKIGFAPFAKYKEKMLPIEKSKNVVAELAKKGKEIYLFGGGKREEIILKNWENLHQNIHSVAGKFTFEEELNFIKNLDVMIAMDSANMHLASIHKVRVVSIWGATHPFLGFLGFGQKLEDCVYFPINCQPCSVFGNKKCKRNDYACVENISEKMILNKIKY